MACKGSLGAGGWEVSGYKERTYVCRIAEVGNGAGAGSGDEVEIHLRGEAGRHVGACLRGAWVLGAEAGFIYWLLLAFLVLVDD